MRDKSPFSNRGYFSVETIETDHFTYLYVIQYVVRNMS